MFIFVFVFRKYQQQLIATSKKKEKEKKSKNRKLITKKTFRKFQIKVSEIVEKRENV